jgi:hypothetical protein
VYLSSHVHSHTTDAVVDVVGSDLASGSEDIHQSSTASAQRQESSSSQQTQKRKPPAKLKVTKQPLKARTVQSKRVRNVRRSRNDKRASTSAVDAHMSGTNGAKKAVQKVRLIARDDSCKCCIVYSTYRTPNRSNL